MKQLPYAPYLLRAIAFMIDFLVLVMVYFLIVYPLLRFFVLRSSFVIQMSVFCIAITCFICVLSILEYSPLQSSLGKLLFGLRVVTQEGKRCSFKQLLVRNSIKIFTAIYLFMIFFHFETINNYLIAGILLSISTNPIWHNFMTITGGEKHKHKLVHDEVAKTIVILT